LTNWRIRDADGHRYVFVTFRLGAGKYVRIHTGRGTNTAADRYWGRTRYVWNNATDTASLRNRLGYLVDKCHYDNPGAGSVYC
jgi:hypothetical protein